MQITSLKLKFGKHLTACARKSARRQHDIAQTLGISDSAVSQMLHGKLLPKQSQLETICRMLEVTEEEKHELFQMLANIRNGGEVLESPFNRMLRQTREACNMDLETLSLRTAIETSRLRILEESHDVIPSAAELEILALHLQRPVEDLMLAAGIPPRKNADSEREVHDVCAPYHAHNPLSPQLSLVLMNQYLPTEDLLTFAMRHAETQTSFGSDLPFPAVVVAAKCKELQLNLSGKILLVLSPVPLKNTPEIELIRERTSSFSLRIRQKGRWVKFQLPQTEMGEKAPAAIWSFPVAMMLLSPSKWKIAGEK